MGLKHGIDRNFSPAKVLDLERISIPFLPGRKEAIVSISFSFFTSNAPSGTLLLSPTLSIAFRKAKKEALKVTKPQPRKSRMGMAGPKNKKSDNL